MTPGGNIQGVVGASGGSNVSYSSGLWDIVTDVGFDVHMGRAQGPGSPSAAAFNAIFQMGAYSFVADWSQGNGVSLFHIDTDGIIWDSQCGTADQAGSTFSITQLEHVAGGMFTEPYVKVVASFSGKLYSCSGTASKTVSGTVRLNFEKIL